MADKNIVVIGAGVAGLTTALLLSRIPGYKIVVIAKHMPGDYDIEYASPWAGANYMPRAKDQGSATANWFAELLSPSPWFKNVVPGFRTLPKEDLRPGFDSATSFTSFKRAVLNHILDATDRSVMPAKVDLVVNCTGLMASKLGGVEDKTVIPARGQIVVVRNDAGKMIDVSGTDDGETEACYVMTRAAGGGTILGGSYQQGDWNPQVDPNLAVRIMKRAVQMCPQLTDGEGIEKLDIIRHAVGLRPVRAGGTRIEKEKIGDTWVVHNYGAGGAGYQSSYGCAQDAVKLVSDALGRQARL
ncbi:D-amino acid oxidase [Aspergillus melleus]|uniref:D-amino acid oxidase n=1 Tax=Aspergillus melleus TaxID=138277 RepID=A0ACC3B096_9EURO|nr:D-amino acid oxidase [Aspergillus melleus]